MKGRGKVVSKKRKRESTSEGNWETKALVRKRGKVEPWTNIMQGKDREGKDEFRQKQEGRKGNMVRRRT